MGTLPAAGVGGPSEGRERCGRHLGAGVALRRRMRCSIDGLALRCKGKLGSRQQKSHALSPRRYLTFLLFPWFRSLPPFPPISFPFISCLLSSSPFRISLHSPQRSPIAVARRIPPPPSPPSRVFRTFRNGRVYVHNKPRPESAEASQVLLRPIIPLKSYAGSSCGLHPF